jgi:uncharacterized repeat protein (TIGR02543 family)
LVVLFLTVFVSCDTELESESGGGGVTITYSGGPGTGGTPPSVSFGTGQTMTIAGNPFFKTGYRFVGWESDGQIYQPGAQFVVPGSVTFTAQWREVEKSYDFIEEHASEFKSYQAGGLGIQIITEGSGPNIRTVLRQNPSLYDIVCFLSDPVPWSSPVDFSEYLTKGGYVHISVYVNSASYFQNLNMLEFGSGSTIDVDEFEFEWVSHLRTGWNDLTFPLADAKESGNADWSSITLTRLVSTLSSPNGLNDFRITDWYIGKDVWNHKFVYAAGDGAAGEVPPVQNVDPDENATLAGNPFFKKGYRFTGWNDGATTYDAYETITAGSGETTFTAQWEAVTEPMDLIEGRTFTKYQPTDITSDSEGSGENTRTILKTSGYSSDIWAFVWNSPPVSEPALDFSEYAAGGGKFHITIYITTPQYLTEGQLEFTTSTGYDTDEYYFLLNSSVLKKGWNDLVIPMSEFKIHGSPDWETINIMRFYSETEHGQSFGNIWITDCYLFK